MKKVSIYQNLKRKPFATFESQGGELLKHEIVSHILLNFDYLGETSRIVVKIEENE